MKKLSFELSCFKKYFATLIALLFATILFAQIPTNGLDVKHYTFSLKLNDSNNIIVGAAQVTTGFTQKENTIRLDLANKNKDGKGMRVTSVLKNGINLKYQQDSQHLIISDTGTPGNENTYTISYEGIPANGLIISKNKFNERTFF